MTRVLNSFKVRFKDRFLDYRLGGNLNLNEIKLFFQKDYQVKKIWNDNRHVLGILIKNDISYFLKLSTTEGISVVTKKEFNWNDYFNKSFSGNLSFHVPKNYDSGLYQNKYFYLITTYFQGKLLCDIHDTHRGSNYLNKYIPQVIELSELIQRRSPGKADGYKVRFISKVKAWFEDLPIKIRQNFRLEELLNIVETGSLKLLSKPRHGDFTPWHMVVLPEGKLGLIDGEHFLPNGVENYDICYFIQRVFSVLKNPHVARSIYSRLSEKGYREDKLKTVLAARAIGGFLDESLTGKVNYKFANAFKDWVISI